MSATGLTRQQIAWCTAQDIQDGDYVNLGIGIPELVANYVSGGKEVMYHSENGVLGFTSLQSGDEEDPDLVNAGKKAIALQDGASFFHHADSFAMIRGGHLDVTILGAMEVSSDGDLANWSTGGDSVPAVGGAMDLVAGVKKVFVITEHNTKSGGAKLVEKCTLPLTGAKVVDRIFTNFGMFEPAGDGFRVVGRVPGLSEDELREKTGARILGFAEAKEIVVPAL